MMSIGVIIVGVIALGIVIRIALGAADRGRVRQYVRDRGGHVIRMTWSPFGRGWFGNEHTRIYDVQYVDSNSQEHRATCKTSLFGGVYWTEDQVTSTPLKPADTDLRLRKLEDENVRLREELRRMRGE